MRSLLGTWYFFFLASIGALNPYLALVLEERGASPAAAAAVLSVFPIGLLLGSPIGTWLADRTGRGTVILRLVVATTVGAGLALLPIKQWWLFAPLCLAMALSRAPASALVDMRTASLLARREEYGIVRLWGSVGFVLFCTGVGFLREHIPSAPLVASAAAGLALLGTTFLLPSPPHETEPASSGNRLRWRDLFATPLLPAVCGVGLLHHIGVASYDHFFSLHIDRLGLPSRVAGLGYGLGVSVEIGLMAIAPFLLRRFGAKKLILFGVAAGLPRWWITAQATSPAILIAVQSLHGMCFGLWWLGSVDLIAQHAPKALRNSAQGLFLAASHGVGNLLAMALAGSLLGIIGTQGLFLVLLVPSTAALVAWLIACNR